MKFHFGFVINEIYVLQHPIRFEAHSGTKIVIFQFIAVEDGVKNSYRTRG